MQQQSGVIRLKKRPVNPGGKAFKICIYIILVLGGAVMLYPLVFGLLGSLVTNEEFYNTLILPMPKSIFSAQWGNFVEVFRDERTLPSILITLVKFVFYVGVNILSTGALGFIFAKMNFKGKNAAFIYLLMSMMIPGLALTVPNYIFFTRLPLLGGNNIFGRGGTGLVDNPLIIFLLAWVTPYNIFLCKQTFLTIPNDFKEAAEIDGMSFFKIIFTVYIPMIKPTIALMTFNQFCAIWNDYLFSMIYLPSMTKLWTIGSQAVQIGANFTGGGNGITEFPKVFAIGIVTMLPPMLAYVLAQRSLIEGLNVGGLKG